MARRCRCRGRIRKQRVFGNNVGTQWSSVALQILETVNKDVKTRLNVPTIGRALAVFSNCMYDAFCSTTGDCTPIGQDQTEARKRRKRGRSRRRQKILEARKGDGSEQVSYAAFFALEILFGKQFPQAKRLLRRQGLKPEDVEASFGARVCKEVIDRRDADNAADTSMRFPQTNGNSSIPFDAECSEYTSRGDWQPLCIPPPAPGVQDPVFPQEGNAITSTSVSRQAISRMSISKTVTSRQVENESEDDNAAPDLEPVPAAVLEDAPTCVPQVFPDLQYGVTVLPFAPTTVIDAEALAKPPRIDTNRFDKEFDEVLSISGTLDDRKKTVAEYWDDNPFKTFPPGQWYRVSLEAAVANDLQLKNVLALQMTMGNAMLDAAIAAWTTKFNGNLVRPVTVIQCEKMNQRLNAWNRPYMGVQKFKQTPEMTWRSYLETPPFPGYVSGHSTFGGAGEAVLESWFGKDYVGPNCFIRRRGGSEVEPRIRRGDGFKEGVTNVANKGPNTVGFSPARRVRLCWRTFKEASDENGISRLYGGVHINADNKFGILLGRLVGKAVDKKARTFTNIEGPGGEPVRRRRR